MAINVPAAQLGAQCEGEEADGLDEAEQQTRMLWEFPHHVQRVRLRRARGARRTDADEQARQRKLLEPACNSSAVLADGIEQAAEHERRLPTDHVDEVAQRQVEQQLRELRQRYD